MVYMRDIVKSLGEEVDYKVILMSSGVTVEGFKSIIYYSTDRIELRVKKIIIVIEGLDMVIMDLMKELLVVKGIVKSISIQGV